MKIRDGFVSNSSSSSFILDIKNLSKYQLDTIITKLNDLIDEGWAYTYNNDKTQLIGSTIMDNDKFHDWLISEKLDNIIDEWGDYEE